MSQVTHDVTDFYDARYRQGYMAEWPPEKIARVSQLIRQLRLPPNGRALDYGCGTGVFTDALKASLPHWEIHGTDLSSEAVKTAAQRLPTCHFDNLTVYEAQTEQFDFIFSHHVLEHVEDIEHTAALLAKLLRPHGHMLHILPSGDPGGLEHGVCLLSVDGIQRHRDNRFFFEEEGHLRRLTTTAAAALWHKYRCQLRQSYYSNHFFGAVQGLTAQNLKLVLDFADPRRAVNSSAAIKLFAIRIMLMSVWLMRQPLVVFRNKRQHGCHGARDRCLLTLATLLYPFARLADFILLTASEREWVRRRLLAGGNEMYLFFEFD